MEKFLKLKKPDTNFDELISDKNLKDADNLNFYVYQIEFTCKYPLKWPETSLEKHYNENIYENRIMPKRN